MAHIAGHLNAKSILSSNTPYLGSVDPYSLMFSTYIYLPTRSPLIDFDFLPPVHRGGLGVEGGGLGGGRGGTKFTRHPWPAIVR